MITRLAHSPDYSKTQAPITWRGNTHKAEVMTFEDKGGPVIYAEFYSESEVLGRQVTFPQGQIVTQEGCVWRKESCTTVGAIFTQNNLEDPPTLQSPHGEFAFDFLGEIDYLSHYAGRISQYVPACRVDGDLINGGKVIRLHCINSISTASFFPPRSGNDSTWYRIDFRDINGDPGPSQATVKVLYSNYEYSLSGECLTTQDDYSVTFHGISPEKIDTFMNSQGRLIKMPEAQRKHLEEALAAEHSFPLIIPVVTRKN